MLFIPLPINIGVNEALLLFGVSLLITYGPKYMPDIASELGEKYGQFKN